MHEHLFTLGPFLKDEFLALGNGTVRLSVSKMLSELSRIYPRIAKEELICSPTTLHFSCFF